ncbi:hypothetical protein [Streptomyces sp. 769]|uniref:hypothetical protein n=1 Tax=Streptomyces sp. 769 TaxID=1262452 RepID=UPI000581CB1A|nr:hypothetical protein [Streptomyces sp. 769]AJC62062.1 hypothetical protein GZL_p00132 [Streptomyces sp. 769]
MTDFETWMAEVAVRPGPGEQRLDQLRGGDGIDGLTDAEAAAWLLKVMADYRREPAGWQVRVLVGRTGPECTGTVPSTGRFNATVATVMDQAQALADTTRRPVKVIHGVHGKPDWFLRTLAKYAAGMGPFTTPIWGVIPGPVGAAAVSP